MPFFRVSLHGSGISVPFHGNAEPAIGFFCHREVRAADAARAQELAIACVLAEWKGNGKYAGLNRGELPVLVVEGWTQIGWKQGLFGRTPPGPAFYRHDD
jgi:hypothetical protein